MYYTDQITKLSWLVYKSHKEPFNKKNYYLKEGDVIKLGRETLLVRSIHVKKNNIKPVKLNKVNLNETFNKNKKNYFSAHTVTSQSLILDEDFNNYQNSEREKNEVIEVNSRDKISQIEIKKEKENEVLVLNSNKKKKVCRICYLEEENKRSNPLIKPCKCSGSMKYIHYECLLHWLKTKLIIDKKAFVDNDFYDIYRLDLLECELCKNHLLNYIRHNNKIYSLIDYQRLDFQMEKLLSKKEKSQIKRENNYIMFDEVLPGKDGFLYRYLVKFNEDNTLKIGRALDNQLILNDISVSRNHCLIRIDQGYNLILEDTNSKFGSLVLIQAEEIEILKGKTLTVQSGTNYFSFTLELPKKKLFSCCSAEEQDERKDYERINSSWVKFDKTKEILNESISGEESNDEKNENKNENNKNINKDNANDVVHDESENQNDLVEIEKEEEKKEGDNEENNIIAINVIKNENNNPKNTNNFNNIDSPVNVSTLKINNVVNSSQLENAMDEIREENNSEVENNYDNRSKNNINDENNKLNNPDNYVKDSANNSEKN